MVEMRCGAISEWDRSTAQEALVHLYLRLNQYFVSGFIIHSAESGKNIGEIDALAVRLPNASEPEREVKPSKFLDVGENMTDLLICEVKSRGQSLQFNDAFRASTDAVATVLRWAGLLEEGEIGPIADEICKQLIPKEVAAQELVRVPGPRGLRVGAMLCSPERWEKDRTQPPFLSGKEIFQYVWSCLCPAAARRGCSTRYDFGAWGRQLEPIVRYFKGRTQEGGYGDMASLYGYLGL